MEYFFIAMLTIALSLAILKIVKISEKKAFTSVRYRQSDIHNILKHFYSHQVFTNSKQTQATKREEKNSVRMVTIDDQAYWVVDNVFYVADLVDNHPDMDTARPVDIANMSKKDIDKMLFILDNLGGGKKDERSGSGD